MRLTLTAFLIGGAVIAGVRCNPFAPKLDNSPAGPTYDLRTMDGVFKAFQTAYSTRDTTVYGQLLDARFTFLYHDYEQNIDVTWGRDEELRATYGLFQNVQRLDLIWNNILSTTADSTHLVVQRGFNLSVTFNPSDIERVYGYASLTLNRETINDPWKIVLWIDQSNN